MNINECIKLAKKEPKVSCKKVLTIILDAAHGEDVSGKCSPDGKLKEYKWSRNMINLIIPRLRAIGYKVLQTNETDKEIGLTKRKNIASEMPGDNKILLSIHNNAAGSDGKWHDATGFEFWTCKGQTKSDVFAECMCTCFKKAFPDIKMRVDETDGDSDKESNFTVLMGSGYSGVLAECLFQDSKKDVEKLLSCDWVEECANAFINSIEFFNWMVVEHS